MVRDAEGTAREAESRTTNDPGMCLVFSRECAGIGALYPDASTAWRNTNDRRPGDRNPPRGCMVFWTGGSQGFGHIAPSVGGGKVRSSDAGGSGVVATRDVGWFDSAWPSLTYAGWAWDVNEVTIPHGGGEEDDMPSPKDWTSKDWEALDKHVADAVWKYMQDVTKPDGSKDSRYTKQLLREIWQKVQR